VVIDVHVGLEVVLDSMIDIPKIVKDAAEWYETAAQL
jgi:hypothetical protein